jgi:hypothetical protein
MAGPNMMTSPDMIADSDDMTAGAEMTAGPAMAGAGLVGAGCDADSNCTQSGAVCITPNTNGTWPDGYCTVKGCPQSACPDGSFCQQGGTMVGAMCLYKCESDANCRTGYKCCDITMPAGTGIKACAPTALLCT